MLRDLISQMMARTQVPLLKKKMPHKNPVMLKKRLQNNNWIDKLFWVQKCNKQLVSNNYKSFLIYDPLTVEIIQTLRHNSTPDTAQHLFKTLSDTSELIEKKIHVEDTKSKDEGGDLDDK